MTTGPTGNATADAFLAELDDRIAGTSQVQQPWASREWLKTVRPFLRSKILADPAAFERSFAEYGWPPND